MRDWINGLSGWQLVLFTLGILLAAFTVAALLGAVLVRLGMRRPRVVRRASGLAEATLRLAKRPLTVVVLDEVAAVIQTGHYTKNISDALIENHDELKALVTEKVSEDPNVRLIRRLTKKPAVLVNASAIGCTRRLRASFSTKSFSARCSRSVAPSPFADESSKWPSMLTISMELVFMWFLPFPGSCYFCICGWSGPSCV